MKYVEGSKRVFLSTGTRFPREVIWAIGAIKLSAAKANVELGLLDGDMGRVIQAKAKEMMKGAHDDMVLVDVFQTGSGTGLNMNANELIAELASAESGGKVHPNDHVNMSQSSNDVGPTAVRVAAAYAVSHDLLPALKKMGRSLGALSEKTAEVYTSGRTHLRDALPVTLGQEFGAYEDAFARDGEFVKEAMGHMLDLPIGGTAVGTGLNADPAFGNMVAKELAKETGLGFRAAKNKFRATRLLTDVASLSAAIRAVSTDLYRLCQDVRLMFSGPLTGLGEIDIPSQEEVAGSSIMPGKTNPVTVESALLACAEVAGLDSANSIAASLGEFELTMGVPLMAYNLVLETKLLSEALTRMASLVVDNIVPSKDKMRAYAESSPALITVISPRIGYDKAAVVGKQLAKGVPIRSALRDLGFKDSEIEKILDLGSLVRPGIPAKKL
ncbi:MAG TPA: lyase family protein [Nitrososphaerales archaeon]|nr:lyase family protein [Nitrososphaerales archaeon]